MRLFTRSRFNEITEKEEVIRIIHRHWFNVFQQFLIIIVVAVLLFGGLFIFPRLFPAFQEPELYPLLIFLETTFALLIWVYAFLIWVDYFFDVWIITSGRVVNIEQKGLFMRDVSELKYSKIQDVTAEVGGFFPTVLNYGDVHVQTAGEEARFLFRQVPDPYGIKNIIMELQKKQSSGEADGLGKM